MGKVLVLYFAGLRDLTARSEEWLELPAGVDSVGPALLHLEQVRPELKGRLVGVRAAVNETFADPSQVLADGDTLALIPPVSGG